MRLAVAVLCLALLVAGSAAAAAPTAAVVAEIYDGDTLRVRSGADVRLLQVDTPEREECYAQAARRALLRLAPPGAQVTLSADVRLGRVDRYGRLLRYVHRGTLNVNLELVRIGTAASYFYRGERGRYAAALLAAARRARAARIGLWGACPRARLDPNRQVATGGPGS